MKNYLTIVIGFIHDFATGFWAATVLAIYWLHTQHLDNAQIANSLTHLESDLFYLGLASVGIVLITGMGRTFTYIENVYGEGAEMMRKKMLIVKHTLLFGIFGTGIYWQYTMVVN